ncbi:hypothetical protein P280DRAFT_212505 [Massarina eburnea CBS 473.64]|uniref:Alcohol acetyltransferase n=1 Tax=Massarina eburnea CBS 473.64 TaxID=1395130 RepID=A0A6A6RI01_9PLEO|nr:hypothetical protein P280DRAFT_212505 [Massarina eburnea CBS 473.64]
MPDITTFERLRACGRAETFSTTRHHLGFFRNVSFAATYTYTDTSLSTPLKPLVYQSLRTVIARHSILSAVPVNEDKSHPDVYFARLPCIDLKTCVLFVEREKGFKGDGRDEELELTLQEQHNRNFKDELGTKPFWRLIVLHAPGDSSTFTAVWVFHHALADGSSALVFHGAFLAALKVASATQSATDAVDYVVESSQTTLIPALDDLHPLPISTLFLIKALLGSILPSWFNPRPAKLWTGAPVTSEPLAAKCKVRSLVLSPSTTKRVLELGRKNRTTMQGTLQSLLASATLANLDEQEYSRVRISGPISLRRFMRWDGGSLDDEFVNGVSEYTLVHGREAENESISWDTARTVRAAIQTELDKKGSNSVIGLLRYVSDMHKFFTEQVGKERGNSLELSNVGGWKASRGAGGTGEGWRWKVGRCAFSQSPNVTGAALAVSVVTGGDGCAVLVFTWHDGIVEDMFVERVVGTVERAVETIEGA